MQFAGKHFVDIDQILAHNLVVVRQLGESLKPVDDFWIVNLLDGQHFEDWSNGRNAAQIGYRQRATRQVYVLFEKGLDDIQCLKQTLEDALVQTGWVSPENWCTEFVKSAEQCAVVEVKAIINFGSRKGVRRAKRGIFLSSVFRHQVRTDGVTVDDDIAVVV